MSANTVSQCLATLGKVNFEGCTNLEQEFKAIKKAWMSKILVVHPDKGGDENKFKKISEAYDTIGDDTKRKQYDNQRSNPFAGAGDLPARPHAGG